MTFMLARKALAAVLLAAVALVGYAQTRKDVYRIGFLGQTNATNHASSLNALRKGLRELGYREGANLLIEYRWADGALDRLPALARELVGLKVDVIVAHGTPGSRAVKEATRSIPIVIASVSDPVAAGLVSSLSRPGGNLTGLSIQDIEVTAKRLELLKQAQPATSRVVYLAALDVVPSSEKRYRAAAGSLGLDFTLVRVDGARDLPRAFSVAAQAGAQAVVIQNAAVLSAQAGTIAALAIKHRMTTVSGTTFVGEGILLGYGVNTENLYRRAAGYIDRILKGARPGDLPIEQPTQFELAVNVKTAKALGLKLPQELIGRADRIIE